MIIYKCPRCNETENLHFNYDYTKQERPVIDIICDECGAYFDPPKTIDEIIEINKNNESNV